MQRMLGQEEVPRHFPEPPPPPALPPGTGTPQEFPKTAQLKADRARKLLDAARHARGVIEEALKQGGERQRRAEACLKQLAQAQTNFDRATLILEAAVHTGEDAVLDASQVDGLEAFILCASRIVRAPISPLTVAAQIAVPTLVSIAVAVL